MAEMSAAVTPVPAHIGDQEGHTATGKGLIE